MGIFINEFSLYLFLNSLNFQTSKIIKIIFKFLFSSPIYVWFV